MLSDEKRHLDTMIAELEDELEEEQANIETLNDKLRKSMQQVRMVKSRNSSQFPYMFHITCMLPFIIFKAEQLNNELQEACAAMQRNKSMQQTLERHNKELKAKLEDMEIQSKSKVKSSVSALEAKVQELEDQLEQENR